MDIAIIIAVVIGVTQLVKGLKIVPIRFLPLVSLIIGVAAGLLYGDGDLKTNILVGIMVGLSASGLFDQTKILTKKVKK